MSIQTGIALDPPLTPAVKASEEALRHLEYIDLSPYQAERVLNALQLMYLQGGIEALRSAHSPAVTLDTLRLSSSRQS